MSDGTRSSSRFGSWNLASVLLAIAAAVVLVGTWGEPDVEIFGVGLSLTTVGILLYVLGFLSGVFSRRR